MKEYSLPNPPDDIEVDFERSPMSYFLVPPSGGLGPDTGLIFWITPWGMAANSEYCINKLMPYLADKHNCVVACLNHHDVPVKAGGGVGFFVPDGWFDKLHELYGIPLFDDFHTALAAMREKGVQTLKDPSLAIITLTGNDYLSWGFLPALDHIAVLGEILKTHELNKKKLILFGSSYGGYIATMILKLMPNTFSLAIENSGFTTAIPALVNDYETQAPSITVIDGVTLQTFTQTPWTFDEQARQNLFYEKPVFFNPAHRAIRNLLEISHMQPSDTELHCFHAPTDSLAPYAMKLTYTTFRKSLASTQLHTITEANLDGHTFKDLSHGMNASMRGLFDYVASRRETLEKKDPQTDFDHETKLRFECAGSVYAIDYFSDLSFQAKLESA